VVTFTLRPLYTGRKGYKYPPAEREARWVPQAVETLCRLRKGIISKHFYFQNFVAKDETSKWNFIYVFADIYIYTKSKAVPLQA